MTVNVSRGGLMVVLAVFGVILYEIRTLLDFAGVSIPIVPYLVAVLVVVAVIVLYISLTDGWKNASPPAENR